MKEFWDTRYSESDYAYGEEPNEFFREALRALEPGKLLMPAEGEGRNAVYAATLGWEVYAFDQSEAGRDKALRLARKHGVHLEYTVADLAEVVYEPGQFDAIGLIFAHFPEVLRAPFHQKLLGYLRIGGTLLLEGFSKRNLPYVEANPGVGGPRDESMLFSGEMLRADFAGMDILRLEEGEQDLREGLYHQGKGVTIQLIAQKKS